jgi:hypothetical protein
MATSIAPTTTPAPSRRSWKGSWPTRRWCRSSCKRSSRFCRRASFGLIACPQARSSSRSRLAGVRDRIKGANAELDALKRAPAPSEDIEARVRVYVRGLAPKVRGIGVGERLSIVWPGAQASSGYYSEHSCDPLGMLAALFPDRMLSLVMTEVERMANDPLPVAQRAPRIAALERELDELQRMIMLLFEAVHTSREFPRSLAAVKPECSCRALAAGCCRTVDYCR